MNIQHGEFIIKLIKNNGGEILNPKIDGLDVEFKGSQGGIVIIEEGAVFYNTKILLGSMGCVHIKKTHPRGIRNTKIQRTNLFLLMKGVLLKVPDFQWLMKIILAFTLEKTAY
ncbi:hypothetical protein [Escherichia coli]|uniref:hypothetical protein n=1 Tax=Escherichia coli TaxID=562 RepID=UPI001FCE8403|nr:hypothetical protein [Escherichia coli]